VNKPGLVSVTLIDQSTSSTATVSRDVFFVWNHTVDKPCTLKANVARTSTIIDVGLGVSLKDVYVMGSYYQGKVNLYERPEGYPTFKVVGTATAEDGFIPLTILRGRNFHFLGFGLRKYNDLYYALPLSGTFEINKNGYTPARAGYFGSCFTVEDSPVQIFEYIDKFGTYLLDKF